MYSIAQIASPGFARSWHEAVAIVQEVAAQIQPGLGVPTPEDLTIDDNGVLSLGFSDEASGEQVPALAGLLQALLEGVEAPQALRDLADENAGASPAHATVASFSQALAFFERPNRINDLRALAGRLGAFREKTDTERELQRLREKVSGGDEPAATAKPEEKKKKKKQERRKPQLSKAQQIALVAAVAVIVFGTLAYRSGLHNNLLAAASGVEAGAQGVVSAGLEMIGISGTAASTPEPGDVPVEAERGEKTTDTADRPVRASRSGESDRPSPAARRSNAASGAPAGGAATSSSGVSVGSSTESAPAPTAGTPAESPAPPRKEAAREPVSPEPIPTVTPMPPPGAVFSDDNPEVEAPVLLRPQLPKEPAPGDDTGIFDMLVDEYGNVAEVRLISPRRRFHDRMLVAAAKAWKFKPATLHGYPVKYRIQIPIILKGMP